MVSGEVIKCIVNGRIGQIGRGGYQVDGLINLFVSSMNY